MYTILLFNVTIALLVLAEWIALIFAPLKV